jgi:hypothetical protein
VEVRADGTLGRRYRVRGDWPAEVQACLEESREQARARGTPGCRAKTGCLFFRDARVTFPRIAGTDGRPLEGRYSTPPAFVEAMKTRGMPGYSDFMFAFSRGELEVEWVTETLEGLHWTADAERNPGWGAQPRAVGEAFLRALEKHRDAGVCMWMLCAGKPETLNGTPALRIAGPPYGISYTQWPIYGGYSLVIGAPDVGVMIHEFNHRYLDNLPDIEGIRLTAFHGLSLLGYRDDDLGYPHLMNTYRSVYLYLVRRDMWRRFSLAKRDPRPLEPFTGRDYGWEDVQADCWFRLPRLGDAELAKLTGLPSFRTDAPPRKAYRLFGVGADDTAKVSSPLAAEGGESDRALNSLLSLPTESAAVLRTATGHWLFVRPDLADVYADLPRVSGRGGPPLPACGYVLEGTGPLLVFRAPPGMPVPPNEIGYFRAP